MTPYRLVRRYAAEAVAEDSAPLGHEGRPHLEKTIGEPGLEDPTRDRRERPVKAEVSALPALLFAPLKRPEGLGGLGAVLDAPIGAEDLEEPGIGLPRREALERQLHRYLGTVDHHL